MNGLQREMLESAMARALLLAHQCVETDDVPVGAVVIDPSGRIVGRGWNMREGDNDPTAHAEVVALREAGKTLNSWNLSECTLVVTLEPCTMCAGAAVAARIKRVAFGAWDPKAGACGSVRDVVRDSRLNHTIEVVPEIMEREASIQLKGFFAERRRAQQKPESDFWTYSKRGRLLSRDPNERFASQWAEEPASPGLPEAPAPEKSTVEKAGSGHPVAKSPLPPIGRRSSRHEGKTRVPPLPGSGQ